MINIQDVSVPTKGTAKYLNIRVLTFDLEPENGISLYWSLHEQTTSTDQEGVDTLVPGSILLEGNLSMPQATYDQWGTDDSHVTNWALTQLGLTKL